jgi:ribosomal protein S3
MSRVYFYNSWVKNDILTGKMPNNTLIADIDYYQYFAITKGSSIGIKTWIFLETHIYNNNHKYISLVY